MSKAVKMDYNTTIEVPSRVESAGLLPPPSMVVRSHDSTSVDFELAGQIMQCAKIAPLEVHMEGLGGHRSVVHVEGFGGHGS